jgi:predicted NUDIX family NTP pyrophosphohydrolase
MPKISAGLLLYRTKNGVLQVLLVHPGGPLWTNKDPGAWSIPKGLCEPGEDLFSAAQREFLEETGFSVSGNFIPLSPVTIYRGKEIHAWAVEGDCDPGNMRSNVFTMEWPPNSGRQQEFPEADRAGWFTIEEAKEKINKGQVRLLDELVKILADK